MDGGDPLAARLAEIALAPDADKHRLRQRCAEAFAADARYRSDERFARVWLALAAASPDPDVVFAAMARHRCGESLALIWIARAFVAEKARRFADADALFARGTQLNAKPRELLAKRRREFERRMRRHWLNNAPAPAPPAPRARAPPEPPTPPRIFEDDATATATQVLALHWATAPAAAPFDLFDEAAPTAAPFDQDVTAGSVDAAPSAFAIFDDDAGGAAAAAAAGGFSIFEDAAAAAPAALAARFDEAAAPPRPTPGGALRRLPIFEDEAALPPRPTPGGALKSRVVAFAEEMSFEERRARVGFSGGGAVQAPKTCRRAFGTLQATAAESMVMTNMKPKRLLFSTASKQAPPRTLRRAEKEDLTINSAIALREMDSLFGVGSPAPPPQPESFRPRAIFRDE